MKKIILTNFFALMVIATISVVLTGCSSDDEPIPPTSADEMLSRSGDGTRDVAHIITFEDVPTDSIAGPTSYGANLYSGYGKGQYFGYSYVYSTNENVHFGINNLNGAFNFWNGGIAISKWNYRSNPTNTSNITTGGSMSADWWYSYNNQCSVYNTASTDGANAGAGYRGSNNFAVIYGYQDSYNTSWMSKPFFTFSSPKNVSSLYVCNTSYAYGVMRYGNKFGASGSAESLVDSKGWFKVIATGYKKDGTIQTAEKYLCDYRDNSSTRKELSSVWEQWRLNFEDVIKVEFNFEGSDSGAYGLNTPAYLCLDNIAFN